MSHLIYRGESDEIDGIRYVNVEEYLEGIYKKLLEKCGRDEVKESLSEHRRSCESIDRNSWRAALYRELENRVDEYCEWLNC